MAYSHSSFSIFKRIIAAASCALTLLESMPASALGPDPDSGRGHFDRSDDDSRSKEPLLRIVSPEKGTLTSAASVKVKIELVRQAAAGSLKVKLNGKDITSKFSKRSCDDGACTEVATVSAQDGLSDGPNILRASVQGKKYGVIDVRSSRFYLTASLGDTTGVQVAYYTPTSVGFRTDVNGVNGNNWVTITTGYQNGVNDPVQNYPALPDSKDPNNPDGPDYSMVPKQDVVYPMGCSSFTYQAIVLKRSDPTVVETETCQNDEHNVELDFQNKMARQLDDTDLVVFGTTPNHTALSGLDTSGLGGTDYTKADAVHYPQQYVILGVKGATTGTAHESYRVTLDPQTSNFPNLTGTMLQDSNNNYNFVPDLETDFQVISGTNASIKVGTNTYTPPSNGGNKFWLLVFDRTALQPVNTYNNGNFTACSGSGSQACGMLFDGRTDGGKALAATINQTTSRNLIFLTTTGCPFDNAGQASSDLANSLQNIGGMIHSPIYINDASKGCGYSLVSVNDTKHVSFNQSQALSWTYFSAQKQLGAVHGFLAKNDQGLYDVAGKDQMLMKTDLNGNTILVPAVDYTFGHLGSQGRWEWPLTETTGELAAYHDISYQLLTDPQVNKTGYNDYDLRFFYTDETNVVPNLNSIIDARLGPHATNPVTQSSWDPATGDEFNNMKQQILTEIQLADSAQGYLTGSNGNGGIRGLLNGTTDTALADASAVADAIGKDASAANSQIINSNASDQMNLIAGILSTASVILSVVPDAQEFGVALGAMSGAFWTGSAALTPLADSSSQESIPGPGTVYDMRLADLTASAIDYQNGLLAKYDATSDAILSDWPKLQTAGSLAGTGGSGWSISSLKNAGALSASLQLGQRMSLWTQILRPVYGVRVATSQTTNNPNKLGVEVPVDEPWNYECDAMFSTVPATSYTAYPSPGDQSKWDINVIAIGPTYDGATNYDYPMSSDLSTMLTTNQTVGSLEPLEQKGLNIPSMQLIANGPMIFTGYASYPQVPGPPCILK